MKYKAIGFDYGGVIFGLPGSAYMYEVAELLNMPADVLKKTFFENQHKTNIEKELSWIELWKHIATKLGHSEKCDEITGLIETFERNKKVNFDIIDLIKKLRSSGYKIGLLSNYGNDLRNLIKKQGISEYFDIIGISSEMGTVKPHPESFIQFCNMLNVKPNELIFIDDSKSSLINAEQIGFTPILYRDFDSLDRKLANLKVI